MISRMGRNEHALIGRGNNQMFLTNYYLGEGKRHKKVIASAQQRWTDKFPNKYVSDQASANHIMRDVDAIASMIYKTAHGTLSGEGCLNFAKEWRSDTVSHALVLAKYTEALTQGKYDGTVLRKLVAAAKEPDTFDYDGEHLTSDEIVDALIVAQDIAVITNYIAESLNAHYRQEQFDLPHPDFVEVFINNGGNELVDALCNGVPVENIICQ